MFILKDMPKSTLSEKNCSLIQLPLNTLFGPIYRFLSKPWTMAYIMYLTKSVLIRHSYLGCRAIPRKLFKISSFWMIFESLIIWWGTLKGQRIAPKSTKIVTNQREPTILIQKWPKTFENFMTLTKGWVQCPDIDSFLNNLLKLCT